MTATAEANDNQTREGAPVKDLYEIGEIPPLGHVPKTCMPGPSAGNATDRRKTP